MSERVRCVVCGDRHEECQIIPPQYRLTVEERAAVRRAIAYTAKRMKR